MGRREKKRILVSPLDWGLGHATRCIPLIKALLARDYEVYLAGEGAQEVLLRREFPALPFLPLRGYRIKYARSGALLQLALIRQFPQLLKAIRYERNWLADRMREYDFQAVISDNRYGLYHEDIPCVILTHQLSIASGWGNFMDDILRQWHYQQLNKFNFIWVPDLPGNGNLAGKLSHPLNPPENCRYVGVLSRMKKNTQPLRYDLTVVLSGPEPARSQWEKKLLDELTRMQGEIVVVRGLPHVTSVLPSSRTINIYNHLDTEDLQRIIQSSKLVIARTGYSTVMDLVSLQQPAVLVPTPGQTEQEYLSEYLSEQEIFPSTLQERFSVTHALELGAVFPFKFPDLSGNDALLENAILQLEQSIG
jgi:Glycosyltransferase family 28 C-terminal domain